MKDEDQCRAMWDDTYVSEEGLKDYVREIRWVLNDDAEAPQLVETVRGRGCRFPPAITTSLVQDLKFNVRTRLACKARMPRSVFRTASGRA
jgi:DNA-binding winged helix-turn-helix (wHTH) protein